MASSKATRSEMVDDLLTLDEVAAKLRVTKRTVQNMIARAEFSNLVRITNTDVRIPVSVYREFVQQRTVNLKPLAV